MALQIEKIKAILFDIDGTLSDTDDRMVQQACALLKPFIRNVERRKYLARWLVMSVESPGNLFYTIADRFSLDRFFIQQIQRLNNRKKNKKKEFWLIDGSIEMLEAVSHLPLAVVSARDEGTTYAFLDQFSLHAYFDTVVTSQTCRFTKPFPDPLLHAAEKIGVPAADCLMVGDTTVDMKAAKRAGMQAVGVLCGFGRERELIRTGADMILPATSDLKQFFPVGEKHCLF